MNYAAAARDLLAIRPYHRALGRLSAQYAPVGWRRVAYGPHRRQYGLLARQADAAAPLAVYFHGGGWQFGSPELLRAFGAYFFRRGYHVWMASHRRLMRYGGRDVLTDAAAALQACFGESPLLPPLPYPRPTLLAGVSSGGQLAALMALRQNLWHDGEASVAGLISCAAPLSLADMGASATRFRFAGRPNSSKWRALDPVAHLKADPGFPAVVLHGACDGLVPSACSEVFFAKARQLEWATCRYLPLPGGDHLSAARWVFDDANAQAAAPTPTSR